MRVLWSLAVIVGLVLAAAMPAAASTSSGQWSFVSAPGLHPPKLQVLTRKAGLARGDFLVANNASTNDPRSLGQPGPMILDSTGQPVWFLHARAVVEDLEQQTYEGKPVLLWIQGAEVKVVDEHYRTVATLNAHAPWDIDGHDAWITGTDIWVVVVRTVPNQDLSAYGGPSKASVIDSGAQEYDLKTGRLLRTWDALNPGSKPNVPLSASEQTAKPPRRKGPGHPICGGHKCPGGGGEFLWDPYHLNSVQALANGDLLLSMRNTSAVYLIDPLTDKTIWTLGGKDSTFKPGAGASFAWQHDARLVDPGQGGHGRDVELTLFNDNNGQHANKPSEGMVLRLDTTARKATLVNAYRHQPPLNDLVLGSMQLLPNGNALVGWGAEPYFTEYTRSGKELLDVRWPGTDRSYRTLFTNSWVGTPYYPPRGAARGKTVYASWNGATQVAKWEVLAGSSATHLKVVASHAHTGFETAIKLTKSYAAYEVRALTSTGHALGSSKAFS